MFLACLGGFWPVLGRLGRTRDPWVAGPPKIQNSKIILVLKVLTKIFFRLLKHPKRLGLGQTVPGNIRLGQTSHNLWAKNHGVQPRGILGNIGGGG